MSDDESKKSGGEQSDEETLEEGRRLWDEWSKGGDRVVAGEEEHPEICGIVNSREGEALVGFKLPLKSGDKTKTFYMTATEMLTFANACAFVARDAGASEDVHVASETHMATSRDRMGEPALLVRFVGFEGQVLNLVGLNKQSANHLYSMLGLWLKLMNPPVALTSKPVPPGELS